MLQHYSCTAVKAFDGGPITKAANIDMAITARQASVAPYRGYSRRPAEVRFQDLQVESLQTAADRKRQHACPINGPCSVGNGAGPLFQIGMGKVATAQFEDNPVGKLDVRIWPQHA